MSNELARVGESRLDHAIRLTGLQFTPVQRNAVAQLFLWHGEIKTVDGIVTLAKLVHKKDDAFWLRKDLSIESVTDELFGSAGMTLQ